MCGLARRMTQALNRQEGTTKTILIPILLFVVDIVGRAFLRVDVADAGADMAFLGFSMFVAIAADGLQDRRDKPSTIIFALLLALFSWLVCTFLVSSVHNREIDILGVSFQLQTWLMGLSWVAGLTALMFTSSMAHDVG